MIAVMVEKSMQMTEMGLLSAELIDYGDDLGREIEPLQTHPLQPHAIGCLCTQFEGREPTRYFSDATADETRRECEEMHI